MPLQVQNDRVSGQIHDAYNVVGRYRAQIDEIIVPVCLVDDLTGGAGAFPLIRRATARASQAAVAGEQAVFRFETPGGVLAVVRQITIRGGTNSRLAVFFGSSFPAPATIAPKAFVDGRIRNRGETPGGVLAFNTQIANLATIHFQVTAAIDVFNIYDVEWPIGQIGGFDFLEFQYQAANQFCEFAISWDEYLIRP